jgi:hypothetical protein
MHHNQREEKCHELKSVHIDDRLGHQVGEQHPFVRSVAYIFVGLWVCGFVGLWVCGCVCGGGDVVLSEICVCAMECLGNNGHTRSKDRSDPRNASRTRTVCP